MARDFDQNLDRSVPSEETPDTKWIAWAKWSGISLIFAVVVIFVTGFDSALLLGWAVGIIIAAMMIVFGR